MESDSNEEDSKVEVESKDEFSKDDEFCSDKELFSDILFEKYFFQTSSYSSNALSGGCAGLSLDMLSGRTKGVKDACMQLPAPRSGAGPQNLAHHLLPAAHN